MKHYSKDKIYFSWLPRKTDLNGWKWLTTLRDVVYSNDGKHYHVVKREPYKK